MERYGRKDLRNMKGKSRQVESGNLFMKFSFSHIRLWVIFVRPKPSGIISDFLKFMRRLLFSAGVEILFTNTCETKKNRCCKKNIRECFCFVDGWMAAEWQMDPSRFELHNLKLLWCTLWITNTSRKVSSSGKHKLRRISSEIKIKKIVQTVTKLFEKSFSTRTAKK